MLARPTIHWKPNLSRPPTEEARESTLNRCRSQVPPRSSPTQKWELCLAQDQSIDAIRTNLTAVIERLASES